MANRTDIVFFFFNYMYVAVLSLSAIGYSERRGKPRATASMGISINKAEEFICLFVLANLRDYWFRIEKIFLCWM